MQDYGNAGPSSYLIPEGAVERHVLGRHLHHYELITRNVMGG